MDEQNWQGIPEERREAVRQAMKSLAPAVLLDLTTFVKNLSCRSFRRARLDEIFEWIKSADNADRSHRLG